MLQPANTYAQILNYIPDSGLRGDGRLACTRICIHEELHRKEGWLKYDVFSKYKGRLIELTKACLTTDEIEAIQEKEFTIDRLAVIRDIFLFSVLTGYAYNDVQELACNHTVKTHQ